MKTWPILLLLLLIPSPISGEPCRPKRQPLAVATAYCLKGHTSSGPTTVRVHKDLGGCIALSRSLAKSLGLYRSGKYLFGAVVEVEGVGRFVFADLMPKKWGHYRVDIYHPTYRECRQFGVKKRRVWVVG